MNSSYNERTKISPAQLFFGIAVNLDRGILLPFEEQPPLTQTLTDSSSKMLQIQNTLFILVRKIMVDSDQDRLAQNKQRERVSCNSTQTFQVQYDAY